jgi:putative transposase
MIDRTDPLPVTKQAKLLGVSRSGIYYLPTPISTIDQQIMVRIDRLHLEFPFAGARMLRGLLRQEGFSIGRKRVARLMKRMGVEALYRKPRTTKPAPGHKIYPYLLRHLPVERANQV